MNPRSIDKKQAQELIKETFESPFDKSGFTNFIKNLLNKIDEDSFAYQGQFIPDSYKPFISKYIRVGKFNDGENRIDILIVYLNKNTSIERARTMQRNFIAGYLQGKYGSTNEKNAALVAFVSLDKADWRFSLVKLDYLFKSRKDGIPKAIEEFTPARRWSFLVGANEKSHTAQSQMVKILADDEHDPTLAELEQAFDIETVTKEFFEKYRELFLHTKEELDRVVKKDPKIKADFEDNGVDTVNFAKKLLGQIVFLYFLQKKGWFGVGRDDDWDTGSKHFLRELFEKKHGDYNNFFNDILEPLFYDALRNDRSHDDGYYSRFNCKIPFLNGGLFDPIGNYDWVHTDIIIPDKLFSNNVKIKEGDIGTGILDVFDRYNFTVKEDEPLEKEVAIDPELLGKSYEKFNAIRPDNFDEFKKALKSGKKGEENKFNKKFGVYYTPREIVHYMCQQSLINYLDTAVNTHKKHWVEKPAVQNKLFGPQEHEQLTLSAVSIPKEDIEALIHIGEQVSENEAIFLEKEQKIKKGEQKTTSIKSKLPESIRKNAKLIDDKLAEITVCDPAVGSGAFPVGMMSEIVKTRNVLTTFVTQASKPEKGHRQDACATYNFKRQCIEHSLYGVDIDPGAVEIAKLRLWLSLVVDEEDIKNIKPLPNLDYKVVCGNSLLGVEKDLFNAHLFLELEKLKPLFFNETNPAKKQDYKKQIDNLISKITNGHKEFDFEIYFSEVFHKKGGFDVVIANPPYVGERKNKDVFLPVQNGKLKKYYLGRMDYFYFFFHLAIDISNVKSLIAFITTNYYPTALGARKLRTDIKKRTSIVKLINFNELKLFESAAGQHNMITILKKENDKDRIADTCVTSASGIASPKILTEILSWKDNITEYFSIPQAELWEGKENYLRMTGNINLESNPIQVVLSKMVNAKDKYNLGDLCNTLIGLESSLDKVYVVRNDEIEKIIYAENEKKYFKPFFKNSDIEKYYAKHETSYSILYLHEQITEKITSLEGIWAYLKKHKGRIADRKGANLRGAYRRGNWWVLNTPRLNMNFEDEKIMTPYRTKTSRFAYNNISWYASRDVYFITKKDNAINLKYILALLNSNLYFLWLFNKGKRKGDMMEIYSKPLSEIPIRKVSTAEQSPFINLADRILTITKDADYLQNGRKQAQVKALEAEIDQLVYKLYDLTPEEIKIVEGGNK